MKKESNEEQACRKIRYKTLMIHGEKYRTLFPNKFRNRKKWQKPDEKIILSVLPGKVVEVFAKENGLVRAGDTMLVLEAMKMQNTCYYPHSGRIKKVNVKKGDKIPKGFVMVEYE
ncbi:MAG: acetyl-CoA carboxylase biotin carboxyl carrier protein subunit [Bacteroidales bacterium]|nr:acetyl-CoA carboxylase biotin carboxyl carrier protein subunit [Bacteroidales bacterium]